MTSSGWEKPVLYEEVAWCDVAIWLSAAYRIAYRQYAYSKQ